MVFMFPGQGSQFYQMGRELYNREQIFRKWMNDLDTVATGILGSSVVDLLYSGKYAKDDNFDMLRFSHPSIFMFEYSLAMTLIEKGIEPDFVLGASLGEMVAYTLSSGTDPKLILELLIRHAISVEECCEEGGMLAVLGDYNLYYQEEILYKNSYLAAINYDTHFIVSGNKRELDLVGHFLKKRCISYFKLPIHYGFHSPSIDPSKKFFFNSIVKDLKVSFKYALVSCVKGGLLEETYHDYLWDVAREKINFKEAVKVLEERGPHLYIDLSPSGTLSNFLKYSFEEGTKSEIVTISTPFYSKTKSIELIKDLENMSHIKRKEKISMNEKIAFVFPGQGSQQKGMGEQLFDEYNDLIVKADKILGYSIKKLCLEDSEGLLGQTQYTQPALFIVNALTYMKKIKDIGRKPDFVAGHSLGEYDALFAAGVIDFETGVKLVKKRGELMSKAVGGGMAAIVGLSEEKIIEILKSYRLEGIDIANLNSPSQIVVSGKKEDIVKAQSIFEAAGAKRYIVLNVSGAFHSRYLSEAGKEFETFLDSFKFSDPEIPVISNVYARPYKQNIKKVLVEQITNSVKWTETIRYLMGKGVSDIEQVGPGSVLTGLMRAIKSEAEPLIIDDEEEYEEKPVHIETLESEDVRQEQHSEEINWNKNMITAESLGNKEFMKDYNIKYSYISGGMYKGIASKEMVVRMGKAGMLGFFGAGGLKLEQVEEAIRYIQAELKDGQAYGFNLPYNPTESEKEEQLIDIYLRFGINVLEAAAFMTITPALARYRLKGLNMDSNGNVTAKNRIIAKVSRPEVAEAFLSPIPEKIVNKLLDEKKITADEARLSQYIPVAEDICVESDSGGHTDHGVAYAIMPAMKRLCDDMMKKYNYRKTIRIGAAGGIGTPEAAAAAFILGADFILTGSINQCTVESGTSNIAKDILQGINIQDTEYAPAGDMFELGAKVQVVRKGVFFPARANKLYELYRHYESTDEIDLKTRKQIEERYFHKGFFEVFAEVKKFYPKEEIEKAEKNPKHKMALIFKWYFGHSTNLALNGNTDYKVDYQIHCGPSLGAFNQWVKGTSLEDWRNRHVDEIAEKLMNGAAEKLNSRFEKLINQ